MTTTQTLTKPQEPWVGSRGRIGVIIPSTNISVEYDCQQMTPEGLTWHFARFFVEQPDLSSDDMFLAFIDAIRETIPDAMRDIMTCEPSYIMMGMSAETFWGGLEGSMELKARITARANGLPVAMGSDASQAALKCYGDIKRIAVVTPYMPVGDGEVRKFFTDCGFEVLAIEGLKSPSPTAIAHVSPKQLRDAVMAVNDPQVEAILQVGTNLAFAQLAPMAEFWLDKPVLAINTATYWHALRMNGIQDKLCGFGSLLEDY